MFPLNRVRVTFLLSFFLNIIFKKYIDLEGFTLLLLLQWLHLTNCCKLSLLVFNFLLYLLHKTCLETVSRDIRVNSSSSVKELDSNKCTSLTSITLSHFSKEQDSLFGELTYVPNRSDR